MTASQENALLTRCPAAIKVDDLPADWRVEWEEKAAIMEYDGGVPREHAEALALTEIVRRMRES